MTPMSIAEIGAVYKELGQLEVKHGYEQKEANKLRATNDRLLEILFSTQQGQQGRQQGQQQTQPQQQSQPQNQQQARNSSTSNAATNTALTEQLAAAHVRIIKMETELRATMDQNDQLRQLCEAQERSALLPSGAPTDPRGIKAQYPLPSRPAPPTGSYAYGRSYDGPSPGRPAVHLNHPEAAAPGQEKQVDLLCDIEEPVPANTLETEDDGDGVPEAEWQAHRPRSSDPQQAPASAPAEKPAFKRYFQDKELVRVSVGSLPTAGAGVTAPAAHPLPPRPAPASSAPPTALAIPTVPRPVPVRSGFAVPYPRPHFPSESAPSFAPPLRALPPPPPGRAHFSYADVETSAGVPSFNVGAGTFVPGFTEAYYDEATVPKEEKEREKGRLMPVDPKKEDECEGGEDDGSSDSDEEGSADGNYEARRTNWDTVAFTPVPEARNEALRTVVLTNLAHLPSAAKGFVANATSGSDAVETGFVVAARVLATGPVVGSPSAVVEFLSAKSAASFVSRFNDSKKVTDGPVATLLMTSTHPLAPGLLRAIVREGTARALRVPAEAVLKAQALRGVLATMKADGEEGEFVTDGDTTLLFESVVAARAARKALIKEHAAKGSEVRFVGEDSEAAVRDVKDARAALEKVGPGDGAVDPSSSAAAGAAVATPVPSSEDDAEEGGVSENNGNSNDNGNDGEINNGKGGDGDEDEPEEGKIQNVASLIISLPASPTAPANPAVTTTSSTAPTAANQSSSPSQKQATAMRPRSHALIDANSDSEDSETESDGSSLRRPFVRDRDRDHLRMAAMQGLGQSRWALEY